MTVSHNAEYFTQFLTPNDIEEVITLNPMSASFKDNGTAVPRPQDQPLDLLAAGYTAVVRFEHVDVPTPATARVHDLLRDVTQATGFETTGHVYYTKHASNRALNPHTDPCESCV